MELISRLQRNRTRQPVEVGVVDWLRELNDAVERSLVSGKPIFALFQEVPGCAGCKQFGKDVLSNRVVVDAIEEAFEALLIHNNSPGRDAELCATFGEPAWNYQVVRFLDADSRDIIPRRDRVWETGPLVERMVEALDTAGVVVPSYLRLIEQENSDRLELVHFAQPCFWVGEMVLGQLDGVVKTLAAHMAGHEVTSVWYDPSVTSLIDLTHQARQRGVATVVFTTAQDQADLADCGLHAQLIDDASYRIAPRSDQKRQIRGIPGLEDLSIAQRTKVNAHFPQSLARAGEYLPPSQRTILTRR